MITRLSRQTIRRDGRKSQKNLGWVKIKNTGNKNGRKI